jgi:hypothetical protein
MLRRNGDLIAGVNGRCLPSESPIGRDFAQRFTEVNPHDGLAPENDPSRVFDNRRDAQHSAKNR